MGAGDPIRLATPLERQLLVLAGAVKPKANKAALITLGSALAALESLGATPSTLEALSTVPTLSPYTRRPSALPGQLPASHHLAPVIMQLETS